MAASTFILKLLTPFQAIHDDEVESVVLPGVQGNFEVRASHAKFISMLVPGPVRVTFAGRTQYYALSGGFCEVHATGVTVLGDSVERADQIDVSRANAARDRALAELAKIPLADSSEAEHWRFHLARAENRIKVAGLAADSAQTK